MSTCHVAKAPRHFFLWKRSCEPKCPPAKTLAISHCIKSSRIWAPGSLSPYCDPRQCFTQVLLTTAVQEHCSTKCDRGVILGPLAECANPLTWRSDSRWVRATMQSRSACLEIPWGLRRIEDQYRSVVVHCCKFRPIIALKAPNSRRPGCRAASLRLAL